VRAWWLAARVIEHGRRMRGDGSMVHGGCFVCFFLCNEWMIVPRNLKVSQIITYLKSVFSSAFSSFSLFNAMFSLFSLCTCILLQNDSCFFFHPFSFIFIIYYF